MKLKFKTFIIAVLTLAAAQQASAQYWQLANQATQMIENAAWGGAAYRGYADMGYVAGIGSNRADILSFSTTQGLKAAPSVFIGLGLGVDVMMASVPQNTGKPTINGHGTTSTGVAIPLFSDFRFDFGASGANSIGAFVDLKIGASFLCGNNYIQIGNGYLLNSQCFYLRPTVGMRVPISKSNPKLAMTIGVSYQLMTSATWYVSNNSMTLNNLGFNVGLEW